jgi:Flp pilus assembly protein TadB
LIRYPVVFVLAAGMLTIGFVWMQKIINFDQ